MEKILKEILFADSQIMSILKTIEQINLPDGWVCAGIIRNKVWDLAHGKQTPLHDIDVIYFDHYHLEEIEEKKIEKILMRMMPNQPWSVKNQARMHQKNMLLPFQSTYDGVAHFPETPTAVAVRLHNNQLEIIAPYGLNDLFNNIVRPTPYFDKSSNLHHVYIKRMNEKHWNEIWSNLTIYD